MADPGAPPAYRRVVLKLSGEALAGRQGYGIDPEILARIKERGLRVCVNTNGWFLGKAQAKRIVEMGVDEMSISVDGPNETHDFIRRREGSFKHILDSLTNLQEAREELQATLAEHKRQKAKRKRAKRGASRASKDSA